VKSYTSVSGGQTSAYLAANYPTDKYVFALVRTGDKKCKYPDKKTRLVVEDRIKKPFVGTLEDDLIINTILDLEQFIGQKIDWVSGPTFDEVLEQKKILPNVFRRFCTQMMKVEPMFYWWHKTFEAQPVKGQFGFRANETKRAANMLARCNDQGFLEMKGTFEKNKRGQNKWENFVWQKPSFPLIEDGIFRDHIHAFWQNKNVRFAPHNNCVGCFHRNPLFLRKMFDWQPAKMEWFARIEEKKSSERIGREKGNAWHPNGISYKEIGAHKLQAEIDFGDFGDCDSGYCGL
jgi:hypothetical protein